MNLKTTKQIPLLITFALLAACSTQNTSVSGSQSRFGGQQSTPGSQNSAGGQSIPGSQLIGQQNKNKICVDKTTGKAIPGCKSPTKLASTSRTLTLPNQPKNNSSMRKIVLKAPKKPIPSRAIAKPTVAKPTMSKPFSNVGVKRSTPQMRPNTSFGKTATVAARPRTAVRRPAPARKQPVLTQPFKARVIANPVRSATPAARPIRPVVKPVVRTQIPVKKPQSTLRRLTLNGSANFKSGSSRLTATGQTKLLALALSLQEGNTQISRLLIEGHTDSVGNASMNQVLSLKRANAVAEYLAGKGGFQRSMMETVGLGEGKPVASNKTRKGRAQNRRVEITATGTRRINR